MIHWTQRQKFINDSANIIVRGGTLEDALLKLSEYADPYVEGEPHIIGKHQLGYVKAKILRRVSEINKENTACIQCGCNPYIKG